jgi:hypothetical protein
MISNRGYIYTVAALMFSLVLLSLISLYYESYRTTVEMDPARIRTDELHYFVESCKKDIGRAMVISGRRAAVYLADYAINSTKPLDDPQGSLKELLINGTITADNKTVKVTHMRNNTLQEWLERFQNISEEMNFRSNLSFVSMDIYHYDSWHFMQVITLSFNVSDLKSAKDEMSRYENQNVKIYSLVPLDGLEDPFYSLGTASKVRRYVSKGNDYDIGYAETLANGIGAHGRGTGGGLVFDISESAENTGRNITDYNSSNSELVPYTLFVMDRDYFSLSAQERDVLALSGGVINYYPQDMGSPGFPYVSDFAKKVNFTNIEYAAFKNKGTSHTVLTLRMMDYVQSHLYHTSRDGPCFFDRFSLNQNLSEKYVNQSDYIRNFFGIAPDPQSGLESFVDVKEFDYYQLYDYGILPDYANQSSVDYEYFNGTGGRWLCATPAWFRLDAGHAVSYNLSAYVCDPALAGYWALDEGSGTAVYDESRGGNSGSFLGAAAWSQGVKGGALQLNGTNYVAVPDDDSLDATGDLTITMWIKPGVLISVVSDIVGKRSAGGYAVEQDGGNYYLVWDSPAGQMGDTVSAGLQTDAWQHFAVVKNGSRVTIYVNGTLRKTGTVGNETIVANSVPLFIGDDPANPATKRFNGEIDELRIWRTALGEQEILDEYRSYQ